MPIRPKDPAVRREEAEKLEELKLSNIYPLLLQIQSRCKLSYITKVLELSAKQIKGNPDLQTLVIEIFKESAKAQEADYLTNYYIPDEVKWLNQQRTAEKLASPTQ